MNTVTVSLTDKQFDLLDLLLDYADEHLDRLIREESDSEYRDTFKKEQEGCRELVGTIHATKTYLWSSGCGHLELEIPAEAVDDIAQPGDNEAAVRSWLDPDQPNHLQAQFALLSSCDMRHTLEDAGIENVDAMPDEVVEQYTLWIACHDISEERNQED